MSDIAQNEQAQRLRIAELERRLAENTLQLDATVRELDAFGSSLSHDLRAPVRSMEGFSRLLLEAPYSGQLDATGNDYVQRIHRASLKLANMMDELLQLVRLARGGVRSENVDLSAIAQEIIAGLAAASPERRAQIEIEPDMLVTGDRQLLRLVLENLLGNAWKFTRKTEAANIRFDRASGDDAPALCVRDNGAGFDVKYADKLFRAFQRLHGESEFEGTGVGLAKVQRALHAQGGRIWARAERGAGAAFFFVLPGMSGTGGGRP